MVYKLYIIAIKQKEKQKGNKKKKNKKEIKKKKNKEKWILTIFSFSGLE